MVDWPKGQLYQGKISMVLKTESKKEEWGVPSKPPNSTNTIKMLWTLGAVYTLAWLSAPWIVTGLTLSLGSAVIKTGSSAIYHAGKGTYYLMTGSSGYLADSATSKDDAWVVLDNPAAISDPRYVSMMQGVPSNRSRLKRHLSI